MDTSKLFCPTCHQQTLDAPASGEVLTNAELTAHVNALIHSYPALVQVLNKMRRDNDTSTFAGRLRWLVLGR